MGATATSAGLLGLRALTLAGRLALLFALARYLPLEEVAHYGLVAVTVGLAMQLLGLELHLFTGRELLQRGRAEWSALLRDQLKVHALCYALFAPLVVVPVAAGWLAPHTAAWLLAITVVEHLGQEVYRTLVVVGRPQRAMVSLFFRGGGWCVAIAAAMTVAEPARALTAVFAAWTLGGGLGLWVGVAGVWSLLRAPRSRPTDWTLLRGALRTALPFLFGTLALRGAAAAERYLLEAFHPSAVVGVYVFYSGLVGGLLALAEAVVSGLWPRLVQSAPEASQWQEQLRRLRRSLLLLASGAAVAGAVAVAIAAVALRGSPYQAGLPAFGVLLAALAVTIVSWAPHYALYALRRDRAVAYGNVATLVGLLLAGLLLIPAWGALGAACAALAGAIASAVFRFAAFRREDAATLARR